MSKRYNIEQLNVVYQRLISGSPFLKKCWQTYLAKNYPNPNQERLTYFDMMELSAGVIQLFKKKKSSELQLFFDGVEEILLDADAEVTNLILAGLLEGIQQICQYESIDMRTAFNKWHSPLTKKHWDELSTFYKFDETN